MSTQTPASAGSTVDALLSSLLERDVAAIASLCATDVTWWTPLADTDLHGPTNVAAALVGVFSWLTETRVDAALVDEAGERAVLETSGTVADGPETSVTIVLRLASDQVVSGRTYLDTDIFGRLRHGA